MKVESSEEESLASSDSPGRPEDQGSQPQEQAEAEDTQAETADNNAVVTVEEEQLLLDNTAPHESPASDASSVTGHMAALQVNTPPCQVTEDGDTSR